MLILHPLICRYWAVCGFAGDDGRQLALVTKQNWCTFNRIRSTRDFLKVSAQTHTINKKPHGCRI